MRCETQVREPHAFVRERTSGQVDGANCGVDGFAVAAPGGIEEGKAWVGEIEPEEVRALDLEFARNGEQGRDRWQPLARLDLRQVALVDAALQGEALLGNLGVLTEFADAGADSPRQCR